MVRMPHALPLNDDLQKFRRVEGLAESCLSPGDAAMRLVRSAVASLSLTLLLYKYTLYLGKKAKKATLFC